MKKLIKKLNKYFHEDKRVFAKGLCGRKIFFVFLIGMLLGCLYEDLLTMAIRYYRDGSMYFITKRGLLYGELSPIYGWGACLMIYLLLRKPRKKYEYFCYGALLGGAVEYGISLLQEMFTHTTSWDYSTYFLNINGRTTIPYMFVWGFLALILVTKIYPFLSKLIESIPYNLGELIYKVLLVIISIDMIISFSACIRMGLRHNGVEPLTPIGKILYTVYNDERMRKSYTNMVSK